MSLNNEYEDDYYETSDFDIANFEDDLDQDSTTKSAKSNSGRQNNLSNKKSLAKKKRSLEDWLEEKRLRDALKDHTLDDL